jgi:hypothetical protein
MQKRSRFQANLVCDNSFFFFFYLLKKVTRQAVANAMRSYLVLINKWKKYLSAFQIRQIFFFYIKFFRKYNKKKKK